MNNQIEEIKQELLHAEGRMIAASVYYQTDKKAALAKMVKVEAQLNKVRAMVTAFLESNHFPEN